MSTRGDREEFGQALNQAPDDGIDHRRQVRSAPEQHRDRPFGDGTCHGDGVSRVEGDQRGEGDGEAGQFIDSGASALGGKCPVNVSGGLLSKGHPLGATGIANIYEVSTHLRGEAGQRQVEGAKIGMTHVIGLGSACGIHILEKV